MISMIFRYPRGSHPENCREISTVFRIALTASCWNGALQIQRSLDDGTMGVPHLWRLRLHGGSPEFSMDPPLLDASIFRAKIPTGYSTPGNKGRCAENTSETWGTFVGRNIILHICVLEILAIDICLELSLITKSYKPHSFGHKYLRISPSISVTFFTPVTITSR